MLCSSYGRQRMNVAAGSISRWNPSEISCSFESMHAAEDGSIVSRAQTFGAQSYVPSGPSRRH